MARSLFSLLTGLAFMAVPVAPLSVSVLPTLVSQAQADDLTRAEIMRQHQELARERGGDASSVGTDDEDATPAPVTHKARKAARPVAEDSSEEAGESGSLVAQLLTRVSALESQVRQMQGQIEQLNNQVQQNQANVTKQIGDMQFALQNGAQSGASAPAAAPAAEKAVAKAAPAAPRTTAQAVQEARAALKEHHYPEALEAAQQAQSLAHSASERSEALYVEGQAAAGQKNYRQAAVAYFDSYNKAPKSTRAPEALLGVSASMLALGNKPAACQALDKLQKEFPAPSARVKASEKLFRTRAACH